MSKLLRYSSSAPAPLPQPVEAQPVSFSDAPAQALSRMGQGLQDYAELRQLLHDKYQSHLDDLRTAQAKDLLNIAAIRIDGIYENQADPARWEESVRLELDDAAQRIGELLEDVSQQRRPFIDTYVKAFHRAEIAKMESLRAKTVAKLNLEAMSASYQQAYANGQTQAGEAIYNEMVQTNRYLDWFPNRDAFDIHMARHREAGQTEHYQGIIRQAKTDVAQAVQYSPDDAEDIAKTYAEQYQLDAADALDLRQYAKSAANAFKTKQADAYAAIEANVSRQLRDRYIDGSLTEDFIDEVWQKTRVADDKQSQFDDFIKEWRILFRQKMEQSTAKPKTNTAVFNALHNKAIEVGLGAGDPNRFALTVLRAENKGFLTSEDAQGLLRLAHTQQQSHIRTVRSSLESEVRSQMVDASVATPDAFSATLSVMMANPGLSDEEIQRRAEELQIKRQVQEWNYSRYKRSMDAFLESNPKADQNAIRGYSDYLLRMYAKPYTDVVKDYREAMGGLPVFPPVAPSGQRADAVREWAKQSFGKEPRYDEKAGAFVVDIDTGGTVRTYKVVIDNPENADDVLLKEFDL